MSLRNKIISIVVCVALMLTISSFVCSFAGIGHLPETSEISSKFIPTYCDKCGKRLTFHDNDPNTNDIDVIAATFKINVDPNSGSFFYAFTEKQVGDYKIGKTYNLCWECLLDTFFKKSSR